MKRCRYREAIADSKFEDGAWGKGVGDEIVDALTRRMLRVRDFLNHHLEAY